MKPWQRYTFPLDIQQEVTEFGTVIKRIHHFKRVLHPLCALNVGEMFAGTIAKEPQI